MRLTRSVATTAAASELANLADSIAKARAAGALCWLLPVLLLISAALMQFPGGCIAEIHSPPSKSSASGSGARPLPASRGDSTCDKMGPDAPNRNSPPAPE
jgi:hypothetical protein